MEALEAIAGRRSIRKFQATPVEEEKLGLILEAARQAPSWANSQCWRFVVVRDHRIKDKLADTAISVAHHKPQSSSQSCAFKSRLTSMRIYAILGRVVAFVSCALIGGQRFPLQIAN